MKICFFTEGRYSGKIPRDNPSRTDQAWICALNADHYYLYDLPKENYDLGIFIIPKKCEDGNFDLTIWKETHFAKLKERLKLVAFMQEGHHIGWQDLRIQTQIEYIDFLNNCNILYCHNEYDKKYYLGLFLGKDVRVLPSLIIEDAIPKDHLSKPFDRSGIMINGNWTSWYSAQDSYFIAQEFNCDIYAPSMGRKQEDEDYIDSIKYLNYRNWSDWMVELSRRKYAVNLMRTIAANTFSLNCAALGIPCLGWNTADCQKICFPELSANMGDLQEIRRLAKHLYTNKLFYDHVSAYAIKSWNDNYSEEKFLEKFYEEFE